MFYTKKMPKVVYNKLTNIYFWSSLWISVLNEVIFNQLINQIFLDNLLPKSFNHSFDILTGLTDTFNEVIKHKINYLVFDEVSNPRAIQLFRSKGHYLVSATLIPSQQISAAITTLEINYIFFRVQFLSTFQNYLLAEIKVAT